MKKSNARNLIGFNINTEKLKKDFGKYLIEDFKIRKYIKK